MVPTTVLLFGVAHRRDCVQARRRALKRLRNGLDLQWVPAASRDELYRR